MKETKGRILFIGYTVPPMMSAQGLSNLYNIKYLSEFGWEVDVLTISSSTNSPRFDKSSIEMLPKSVRIFRTYPGLHKIYYNIIKPKSNISKNKAISKKGSLSIIREKVLNIVLNLMMPDAVIFWYPFAVLQGIKLINKYNYDILISSGPPYTTHLIGHTLKKLGDLHWIMVCGDPWVFAPTRYKHKTIRFCIEHKLEEHLLKSAGAIAVTTEETGKNYLENYPFLTDAKVNVIPMGVDYSEFKNVTPKKSEKFRILYSGSLYKNQEIEPFLDALKLIYATEELKDQIEVILVGNIEDNYIGLISKKGLKEKISVKGFVPPKKVPSLIMGADILLYFGAMGGLQLGSKLFYYIAAKRPILCIRGDERDPSLKILQGLNRGVMLDNKKEEIYSGIISLYNLYQKQELDETFDLREIHDFSWENRVKILDGILDRFSCRKAQV